MENMLLSSKDNGALRFLSLDDAPSTFFSDLGVSIDPADVAALDSYQLLPIFKKNERRYILFSDLQSFSPVLTKNQHTLQEHLKYVSLLWSDLPHGFLIRADTRIDFNRIRKLDNPAFFSAVRNLIADSQSFYNDNGTVPFGSVQYFSAGAISTTSQQVFDYVVEQLNRAKRIESSNASQFANSAYYMGSKRALATFLVEAILSVTPQDGIILDLMCGSGAASGAFSKVRKTYASDAQKFCRILALVQGGGFSLKRAQVLLNKLMPIARKHMSALRYLLHDFLSAEDRLFHGDTGSNLYNEYRNYIDSFPTYPERASLSLWNPVLEVEERRKNPALYPYCLFTAYFANIYFGLRQCVEIDSIRYAISQIEEEYERKWALGALISAMSALGTTYAGHFAQPVALSYSKLPAILERRSQSLIYEFSIRLLNLANESERSPFSVETIPGPWNKAVSNLDRIVRSEPLVVYLDAPYKRDEYSRYYHVLETVVDYTYPTCVKPAKIPLKTSGERFRSEFATRNTLRLNQLFIDLIISVLCRGWRCAWSYADTGDADIMSVLSGINDAIPVTIKTYSAPYQHKAQSGRGRRAKSVTEYLIIISRR